MAAASFFNLDTSDVPGDSVTAGSIIRNAFVCDFEAVIFCRKESMPSRKNLVVSFMIAYGIYLIISLLLSATFLTSIVGPVWRIAGLWVFVPWMAFQFAYGVGPSCFPMVPTCLLQDVMLFVEHLLPMSIKWPDSLQNVPGCAHNMSLVANSSYSCMKSCRKDPFNFNSWESSVSWMICGLVNDCHTIPIPDVVKQFTSLHIALANYSKVHEDKGDLWHGHQFCFFVTLGQLLPYIVALIALVYGIVQVIMFPVLLLASGFQFAWQALAYTHVE